MAVNNNIYHAANNVWLFRIKLNRLRGQQHMANDSNKNHSGQSEKHSRTNRKKRGRPVNIYIHGCAANNMAENIRKVH